MTISSTNRPLCSKLGGRGGNGTSPWGRSREDLSQSARKLASYVLHLTLADVLGNRGPDDLQKLRCMSRLHTEALGQFSFDRFPGDELIRTGRQRK
jgi:hypothetical protein